MCLFILVTENKNMCSWCGVCFHASGKWNYRHQNKARTKEGVQLQWIKKKQKYRGLISCLNFSSGLSRNKQMYPLRFLPQLCPSVSLELSHRISVHTKHEWVSSDTYQKQAQNKFLDECALNLALKELPYIYFQRSFAHNKKHRRHDLPWANNSS